MTRLQLEQAPTASLPRRFLLSAPVWGMFAGALLMVDGAAPLHERWYPATLALVHVFTLGVLGNLMMGSLLQFLPVAAAVRIRGGARLGLWLHGLFNLGVLALVLGLHESWYSGLSAAAVLLPAAFLLLGAITLPGLWVAGGQRLLRAGFGMAIGFAVCTALLGGMLALGLGGWMALPLAALTDIHASWGVLGWVMLLMATVARVVMPMFQGTGSVPEKVQVAWLGSVALTLLAAAWLRWMDGKVTWLAAAVAVHALWFACAVLWLQWRAPRPRRGPLLWSWRAGTMILALAALALLWGVRGGVLAGVLGLAIALPLLLLGMAQEIIAFIGWLALQRRCGRGMQLPGVQRLLPERDKLRVLLAQLPPAMLLTATALWPSPLLARAAGLTMLLAWLGWWLALDGVRRRANRFALTVESRR